MDLMTNVKPTNAPDFLAPLNDLLSAALGYAERGWKVFPLQPRDKKPFAGSRGVLDATDDPDIIRQWWTVEPSANIGLALGDPSGVDALDIDPRHGSDVGFENLLSYGKLPETPESQTGGGGRHIFFLHHPNAKNDPELEPGIEFRSTGYYVVLPPSVHPETGRQYEWLIDGGIDDLPFADLPFWLLDRVGRSGIGGQEPLNGRPKPLRLEKPIPVGQRNNALMSVLGGLRRDGTPREALLAVAFALRDRWMEQDSDPNNAMSDREIIGIVDRVAAHPPDVFHYAYQEQVRRLLDDQQQALEEETAKEIVAVDWDGLCEMAEPPEWLVENLIPYPGVAILQGDPGIGKTWLGMSIMLSVARGSKWLRQYHVKEGRVLAILGEEWSGAVKERLQMLARASGFEMSKDVPINYVLNQEVLLHEEGSRVMNLLLHDLIVKHQPTLIVFDPFLLMHLAEENDNSAMRSVMRLLDDCTRITDAGSSVLVCHHVNKPKDSEFASVQYRARGASAIVGHVDSILDVQGEFGYQTVTHAKSKRGPVEPKWVIQTDYSKMNKTMELKYKRLEQVQQEREENQERAVQIIFQEAVEPLSKRKVQDVAKSRGVSERRAKAYVEQFIDAGLVRENGNSGGHPLWEWCGTPATPLQHHQNEGLETPETTVERQEALII